MKSLSFSLCHECGGLAWYSEKEELFCDSSCLKKRYQHEKNRINWEQKRSKLACIVCGGKEGLRKKLGGVNYFCEQHQDKNKRKNDAEYNLWYKNRKKFFTKRNRGTKRKKISDEIKKYLIYLTKRHDKCFNIKCDECGKRNETVIPTLDKQNLCDLCREKMFEQKKAAKHLKEMPKKQDLETARIKQKTKKTAKPILCADCGMNEFIPKGPRHKFCNECAMKRQKESNARWYKKQRKIKQKKQDAAVNGLIHRRRMVGTTPIKPLSKEEFEKRKCSKCHAEIEEFRGIPGRFICENKKCRKRYVYSESREIKE